MSTTSKSPRRVAWAALHLGQRSLPPYAHKFAPKIFTQPQLLACLVLKRFHKTDDRGIEAILRDHPTLCADLALRRVPDHTTLFQAERRLMRLDLVRRMFFESVHMLLFRGHTLAHAADSTGLESGCISPYFVRRRDRSSKQPTTSYYTRFPKLHLIVDGATHLILAAYPKRGPTPDVGELDDLLGQLHPGLRIRRLYADAGYDSEPNHQRLREHRRIRGYIPPRSGRPTHKPPSGHWRRLMRRLFRHPARLGYGQRWQVETVFSMIKRNLGHALRGKRFHAHNRQMLLAAVTHNAMILRRPFRGSQRSTPDPFSPDFSPDPFSPAVCEGESPVETRRKL